ncbi:MAG: Fe-S cluster assembly protein NifU [Kiritimatiellae bacterium]|nr:Fe-S cluster assembly protein NifU [Kiritimatiellia bacterium]MBO7298572.1 Fe-S cluster assembly protein NifU [Kiritimatiellia bacterium]
MWNYTDKVLDHFHNPRNVGKIENPDGVGQVGALACGDALTLMFKLDENGKIADVKFQTFGCASAIASSSALTEMIKGMTLEEAQKVTNQDIAEFLGGLPEEKMHCSVMGREALEAAIHNYKTGETTMRSVGDDPVICQCFDIHKSEIVKLATENHLTTVEQITNYCKAGGACGKCKADIQEILNSVTHTEAAAPKEEAKPRAMTQLQKMKLIEQTIETEVRPLLQRDGGDIELIDIRGNEVVIAFRGMCAGCRSAHITKQLLVEAKLKEFVTPEITVVEEGEA